MKFKWEIKLSIILILLTVAIYGLKILAIGDSGESNTLTYIFNALGFLPLNVLFVTLIINGLLSVRDKRKRIENMKPVLGTFFSEFGSELLKSFVACDTDSKKIREIMSVCAKRDKAEFAKAQKALDSMCPVTKPSIEDLIKIKTVLSKNHDFMLRAAENSVLLYDKSVAELMQQLFHLDEELSCRENIAELPLSDIKHLTGDINRVYCSLSKVWLGHMQFLSDNYTYLFSLALRKSPFAENNDVVVREP